MATTSNPTRRTVNLSGYHGGQIVRPVVEVANEGQGYHVWWHWTDESIPEGQPGREYGHGEAAGDYQECQRALTAGGIRTDDHRF